MSINHEYHVAHSVPTPYRMIRAFLNHIINAHYQVNFACGKCLSTVMTLGQQMKRHISECPGLPALPKKSLQESAHGESLPKKRAHGSSGSKSKDGGSKHKHKCQPNKSQLGETASQEHSQSGNCHLTRAGGTSQESMAGPSWHHSSGRRKGRRCTRRSLPSDLAPFHLCTPQQLSHFLITHFTLHSCLMFHVHCF